MGEVTVGSFGALRLSTAAELRCAALRTLQDLLVPGRDRVVWARLIGRGAAAVTHHAQASLPGRTAAARDVEVDVICRWRQRRPTRLAGGKPKPGAHVVTDTRKPLPVVTGCARIFRQDVL